MLNMLKKAFLFFTSFLLFSQIVSSAILIENGRGLRKATFFKIKVYEATLFLEKKKNDPQQIINSKEEKKITMTFKRGVDKGKLVEGWETGFKDNNSKEDFKAIKSDVQKFLAAISDVKDGNTWTMHFTEGKKVEFTDQNQKKLTIENELFAKGLLKVWFGTKPSDEDLQKALLGNAKQV